jgi:RNA polymerase sporulation-specific sigma factor
LTHRKRCGLYYIGGSDVLPQPLSREEEATVIQAMEAGDEGSEEARQILIERNLRLVAFIARRYENPPTVGVNIEDLISIGTLGLIKAVNTFRSDKNIKLATYASRCIENEILMYFRKVSGRQEVSLDEPLNTDPDGGELLLSDVLGSDDPPMSQAVEEAEERVALRRAVAALEERERLIIRLRFGLDGVREMTQSEVAELLGISQSYISRLEKKILRKLRTALEGG